MTFCFKLVFFGEIGNFILRNCQVKNDIKKETYCNISLFSQNTRRKWKLSTSTANVHK